MKTIRLFLIIFSLTAAMLSYSFAQDNTKVGLPEGAIARLGKGGINLIRFSPDGARLAVGTDVGVWVYDVSDGKETALFTGHKGQVNALVFSTDGKMLASGGFNNPVIQLWDLETGNKLSTLTLTEEYNSIAALAFSQDNATLTSLDRSGRIIYWAAVTGKRLEDKGKVNQYQVATVSHDVSTFATEDKHGQIHLWDAATGKHLGAFGGDTGSGESLKSLYEAIRAVAFSPDGKTLAIAGESGTLLLWNTEKRTKYTILKGHKEQITAVAFSADSKTVASGDAGKIIKLWDVHTGRERATLIGHKSTINALTFTPNEAPLYAGCLVSGSVDGTIRFWDPDTGKERITFTAEHTQLVKAVAFSENDTTLASAAFNGTVKMWNLKTGEALTTFTQAETDLTGAVALSSDARYFASRGGSGVIAFKSSGFGYYANGPGQGNIQLLKITTGEQIPGPWQDDGRNAHALAISPDNKILVASIPDHGIRAWNIDYKLELFNFKTVEPFERNFVFSPAGTLLATNGIHVQTRIWDVNTQDEITPPDLQGVSALAFSSDGVMLAHGHPRDGIVLWHVTPTGMKERSRIPNSWQGFNDVLIFSPNGETLLVPKVDIWDPIIQLWDVETGEDLGAFSGHTGPIETLAFSHDRKTLASGSEDGTVLLWDWEEIINKRGPGNNR